MSSVFAIATPWPWTPSTHAALTPRNAVLFENVESRSWVWNDEQSSKSQAPIGGPLASAIGAVPVRAAVALPLAVDALAPGGTWRSGSSWSSAWSRAASSASPDEQPAPVAVHTASAEIAIQDRPRIIAVSFRNRSPHADIAA